MEVESDAGGTGGTSTAMRPQKFEVVSAATGAVVAEIPWKELGAVLPSGPLDELREQAAANVEDAMKRPHAKLVAGNRAGGRRGGTASVLRSWSIFHFAFFCHSFLSFFFVILFCHSFLSFFFVILFGHSFLSFFFVGCLWMDLLTEILR
jgi:hypothetical protein